MAKNCVISFMIFYRVRCLQNLAFCLALLSEIIFFFKKPRKIPGKSARKFQSWCQQRSSLDYGGVWSESKNLTIKRTRKFNNKQFTRKFRLSFNCILNQSPGRLKTMNSKKFKRKIEIFSVIDKNLILFKEKRNFLITIF